MRVTGFRTAGLYRSLLFLIAATALSGSQARAESAPASAMKDVRSAEEAVGKWSFEGQAAGFSGSIALVLRKNQTFTLTIDGKQNGVATHSVRDGAWAWNETTRAVHLSGDAPPVELGSFERVLSLFSTGSAALVFLVAVVLSFGASIYLLRRYRAAVQRLMRGLAETAPPPETPGVRAAASSRPPITVTTIAPEEAPVAYAPIRRRHFRTMAVYAAAGTCQAVFAASLWIKATGQPLEFVRTVILILVHLWPVLLCELMLWGRARLAQILSIVCYLMLLAGTAARSSTPPMMVGGVRMSAAGQVLFLWAGIMLVPTLAVWTFLRRPVRAAGPLTFTFSLILLFGVLCGMALLQWDFGDSRFAGMLAKIPVNSWVLILGVPLLGGLCFAPIGWFTGRLIGRLYDRKKINDQTITIDALWLTFSMVEGLDFVIESGSFWGILQVLILFALYRGVFILLSSRRKYGPENNRLLLLRVFRGDRGSDRLMENFGTRWRYGGSIQLIGGPDLATANVQPNQFLDFLRRRLADYFIKDSGGLTRRLNQLDFSRDADGRFRVNEMLCQGEVWKETVQHVVGISDAVLMDLRGFSRDNRGCRFELRVLFETVALDRIVLLTDHRSVGPDLDQAIAEAWQATTLQGPNGKTAVPVVRVIQLRRITSKSSAALCHALLSGIAVSRVSTTAA